MRNLEVSEIDYVSGGIDANTCISSAMNGFGVGIAVGGPIGSAAGPAGAVVGGLTGGLVGGAVAVSNNPACGTASTGYGSVPGGSGVPGSPGNNPSAYGAETTTVSSAETNDDSSESSDGGGDSGGGGDA